MYQHTILTGLFGQVVAATDQDHLHEVHACFPGPWPSLLLHTANAKPFVRSHSFPRLSISCYLSLHNFRVGSTSHCHCYDALSPCMSHLCTLYCPRISVHRFHNFGSVPDEIFFWQNRSWCYFEVLLYPDHLLLSRHRTAKAIGDRGSRTIE
jgi:hypothetical protein